MHRMNRILSWFKTSGLSWFNSGVSDGGTIVLTAKEQAMNHQANAALVAIREESLPAALGERLKRYLRFLAPFMLLAALATGLFIFDLAVWRRPELGGFRDFNDTRSVFLDFQIPDYAQMPAAASGTSTTPAAPSWTSRPRTTPRCRRPTTLSAWTKTLCA